MTIMPQEGHRIGHGGVRLEITTWSSLSILSRPLQGYYDTYYEKCTKMGFRPKTVGEWCGCAFKVLTASSNVPPALAYACVRCESIPTHEHDTLLDKVIFSDHDQ